MREGKWIPGLTPGTPVVDAARRTLAARLHMVQHYLPLAVEHSHKDIENVHQLRVATRRAAAALRMFEMCLPEKRAKTARKQLRRLRRAAGDARDWDVFLKMLAEWGKKRPAADAPGLDFLRGYAFAERRRAQKELIEANEKPFDAEETIAALGEPADFTAPRHFGELAGPLVEHSLDDLDRAIAEDTGDYDHLHQIRITGKRLRYAMEIVADCFAPAFRQEMYPAVEEMQEILGDANDSHVAADRIAEIRERLKQTRRDDWRRCWTGLDRLLKSHQKNLSQARKKFAAWLKAWRVFRAEFANWSRLPQPATPA